VERNYRTDYPKFDNRATLIVDSPYFSVRVLEFNDKFHRNLLKYDSFIITMCIEGDCTLRVRSTGNEVLLKAGHSTLIPAAIADYDLIPLNGKSRILDAFIDNRPATFARQITSLLHIER
jgi:mannose-6-phosphate isomerase